MFIIIYYAELLREDAFSITIERVSIVFWIYVAP